MKQDGQRRSNADCMLNFVCEAGSTRSVCASWNEPIWPDRSIALRGVKECDLLAMASFTDGSHVGKGVSVAEFVSTDKICFRNTMTI